MITKETEVTNHSRMDHSRAQQSNRNILLPAGPAILNHPPMGQSPAQQRPRANDVREEHWSEENGKKQLKLRNLTNFKSRTKIEVNLKIYVLAHVIQSVMSMMLLADNIFPQRVLFNNFMINLYPSKNILN